jgi:putative ABC transport system permease protein
LIPRADRLLARASRRYLTRHPWQLVLTIVGIAIGVAVVVAVDIATMASMRAFELSMEAVSGRATHRIVGGPGGLDEKFYRRLRVAHGLRASAPIIEGYVEVRGETLRLLGLDPFADALFRDFATGAAGAAVDRLITESGSVLLAASTSARLKLRPGEQFTLKTSGRTQPARLLDYLEAGRQPTAAVDGLMIADIATAQTLLDHIGRLSWIDLKRPAGAKAAKWRAQVMAWLPPGAILERAQARGAARAQMTDAFITNLTAMSLLALLVGMFLIYGATTLSVLRRRQLIANLRILGVTRAQVFGLVLAETLALSLIAVLIGLPAGIVLGQGLIELVTRTINDLYFTLTVNQVLIAPLSLIKGVVLGVGASGLAALVPAWEAAHAPPREGQMRSSLEGRVRRLAPRLAAVGLILMLFGWALLMPGRSLALGFGALCCLALGYACLTPYAVLHLARLMGGPFARVFGMLGQLVARGAPASLSRTGVAAAALIVAVAAAVGVTIMIDSFRGAVTAWLESSLQADLYLSTPDIGDATPVLAPGLVRRIARIDGVQAVSTGRWVSVRSDQGRTQLRVLGPAPASRRTYSFKAGDPGTAWRAFLRRRAVLVSEPYAYRHQLAVGDDLKLRTERGTRRVAVAGIFYDYGSEQGAVLMRRGLYERFWNDRGVASLGVYLEPNMSTRQALARVRAATRGDQRVLIRSNRDLRAQSLAIFDRTFAITHVLRGLAMLVAVVGILSALMALLLERAREFAILRATGFTPAQVGLVAIGETGLLGLLAGVLAIPLGIILSLVLIEVINRRAFGWSMPVSITPEALLQAPALALGAAVLAGLYPAWQAMRARPAEALRSE